MWPELLEPIDGAVTPSSVRFRMTLRAGSREAVVSVDDIARMDMKHLHATMFTHLRELHFLIRACAGAGRAHCSTYSMIAMKQGRRTCASCTSCLLTACALWRVFEGLQHTVYSPVPAHPQCGLCGLPHRTTAYLETDAIALSRQATHLNRGDWLQWLSCSASHAMRMIVVHGQDHVGDA